MGFTLGSSTCCPPQLQRPKALVPSRRRRRRLVVWAHGTPPPPAVVGSGSFSRRRAAAAALLLLGASSSSPPPLFPIAAALQVNPDSVVKWEPGSALTDELSRAESYRGEQTNTKHLHEAGTPVTSFLAVLNSLGVIASGVLGVLYAISRQDKAAAESDIQTMESLLKEKETAIHSVKKAFQEILQNEKQDRQKMIGALKEREAASSTRLASANATISGLGNELRSYRSSVSDLQQKLDHLQSSLSQVGEEKRLLEGKLKDKTNEIVFLQDRVGLLSLEVDEKEKSIGTLQSSLAAKESECERLSSLLDLMNSEQEDACSSVERFKIEVTKTQDELDLRNHLVGELNRRLHEVTTERDEANQNLLKLQDGYKNLKSASTSKEQSDAQLLSKKEEEIKQLDGKLALAMNEAETAQGLVVKLDKERDTIKALLEEETIEVKRLQSELQHAHECLGDAKLQASDWEAQLEESERRCQELESKIARIQWESSNAEKLLKNSLDEARSSSSILSGELALMKEALSRTEEELHRTSDEFGAVLADQESLKRELVEVYKKAESTAQDLKEERMKAATLSQELEASVNQIKRDSEAVMALEGGLNEVNKSLDDMNQTASSLSRELKTAGTRIKNLEEEKEILYNTLVEQNKVTLEAQENIEDAQNLIMRLGSERENLERRAKHLEDDLAAAKCEILRMRRERNAGSLPTNRNQGIDKKDFTSVVKKNGRRKRTESPSQGSQ